LAASSGFGRQSMIASESNQIPESRGSGRVADKPGVERLSEFKSVRRHSFDIGRYCGIR
jgi:hypothetical protein